MRVLVAPQEFKGSLTASAAARAIAKGIRNARPTWELDVLPLADGGPGFLDALAAALPGAEWRTALVHDALGRPREGRWLLAPNAIGAGTFPPPFPDFARQGGAEPSSRPNPSATRTPPRPRSRERGSGGEGTTQAASFAARESADRSATGGHGLTAFLEAAEANGLVHIPEIERDALAADSFGVGELIAAALEEHSARMVIGVGGSATTDGGAGMARALGARFFDAEGRDLPPGGGDLVRLDRIEWSRPAAFAGIDVAVATDVTNPLTGANGAAHIYGAQKGATPVQCVRLDAALVQFAAVVRRDLGVDIETLPGGGAAGGLAAGLVAFLGVRIESGFELIAQATNLRERIAAAGLVVTGEGSFDRQSVQGKVTGRVLALAEELGVPAIVLAGRASLATSGAGTVATIASVEPDPARAMANAAELLTALAAREMGLFGRG